MPSRTFIVFTAITLLFIFGICSYFSPSLTSSKISGTLSRVHGFTKSPHWSPRPFLPLEEAKATCSRMRLDAYKDRSRPRKIYDMFFMNTELDWLEIRLGELHEQIDFFVVLESTTTFSGEPKPLYLKDNWHRFKPYHHQIIYKELNCTDIPFEDSWARERYQRNAVYETVVPFLEGDQNAELDDILITSDIDEIPKPTTPPILRNCALPPRTTLHSDLHYYSFQWRRRSGGWGSLKTTQYRDNGTILPADLRGNPSDVDLMHTSWHCSGCLPTLAAMVNKIQSFSHREFDRPEFTDRGRILQRVRAGVDLFERDGLVYDRVEAPRDVPGMVVREGGARGRFAYLVDRDGVGGGFADFVEGEDLVVEGWEGGVSAGKGKGGG